MSTPTAYTTDADKGKDFLVKSLHNMQDQQTHYVSWGSVDILYASLRMDEHSFLILQPRSGMDNVETDQVALVKLNSPEAREHLEYRLHDRIYRRRKNVGSILHTTQRYAGEVGRSGMKVPPILDDQAQLLGPNIRSAREYKGGAGVIERKLRGRFALNLGDGSSICLGSDPEEAFVAAQVLEKACKSYLLAKSIGGAKSINIIEAWLMHKYYLLKYSRESRKNL